MVHKYYHHKKNKCRLFYSKLDILNNLHYAKFDDISQTILYYKQTIGHPY